jgi:hypothetical protein
LLASLVHDLCGIGGGFETECIMRAQTQMVSVDTMAYYATPERDPGQLAASYERALQISKMPSESLDPLQSAQSPRPAIFGHRTAGPHEIFATLIGCILLVTRFTAYQLSERRQLLRRRAACILPPRILSPLS